MWRNLDRLSVFLNVLAITAAMQQYYAPSTTSNLCSQIARFAPNMCRFSATLQYCNNLCTTYTRDYLDCGKRAPLRGEIDRRIVGGVESRQGEWPWQVSLFYKGKQYCAGSILSEYFILTAAHCFEEPYTGTKSEDWKVSAGDHQLSLEEDFEQTVDVRKIIPHPKYSVTIHGKDEGLWVLHNDVAIVQLKDPIRLHHANKASICLPDNDKNISNLHECYIIGWGHTSHGGQQSDVLRHAKVYTVPNAICNMEVAYNNTVNPKELICAGYKKGGIDACNYDSGGAMVCQKEGLWYATGIVSSGFECARPHSYGLYTNVAEYKEWIIENILSKAY